ncbi:MAG: translocation/assembly module TamB domain-containing protein [Pseudomonadales bacterium]
MIRFTVYLLLTLVVLIFGALYWLCFTTSGAASLTGFLDSQVEGIAIEGVDGTLTDSLRLGQIRITTDTADVKLTNTRLQLDPFALMLFKVNLYELEVGDIQLTMSEATENEAPTSGAVNIPIAINIMDGSIDSFTVRTPELSHDLQDIRFAVGISANRLLINHLTVSDQNFSLTTHADALLAAPWTLTSSYHLRTHNPDFLNGHSLSVRGHFRGDIEKMMLEGLMEAPWNVRYRGTIENIADNPGGNLSLSADKLDLAPLISQPWEVTDAFVELSGKLERYKVAARGDILLPDFSPMSYALKGSGNMESLDITQSSLQMDNARVSFDGKVDFAGEPGVSGNVQAHAIPLSLAYDDLDGVVNAEGSIDYQQESGGFIDLDRIYGSLFEREIIGQLRITGKDVEDAAIDGELRLGTNILSVATRPDDGDLSFSVDAPDLNAFHPSLNGAVEGNGRINLAPPYTLQAEMAVRRVPLTIVDPASEINVDGKVAWNQLDGYTAELTNLHGALLERPISGDANLSGTDLADIQFNGQLKLGENSLEIKGNRSLGELDFKLKAPRLDGIYPGVAGNLEASGHLRAVAEDPVIRLKATSDKLVFREHQIEGLNIDIPEISYSARSPRSAAITWSNWDYNKTTLGGVDAKYDGTLESGQLRLNWARGDANVDITLFVQGAASDISGSLHEGTVELPNSIWRSDERVTFEGSMQPLAFQMKPHCWRHADSQICFSTLEAQNDRAALALNMSEIPIEFEDIAASLGNPDIPGDLSFKTRLGLQLDLSWQESMLDAKFAASLPQAQLAWSEDQEPVVIGLESTGHLRNSNLEMVVKSMSGSEHNFYSEIIVPDLNNPTKGEATLQLNGNYVPLLTAFAPQLSQGEGDVIANLRANTTGAAPTMSGELRIPQGASVAIPAMGIRISDIEFSAQADSANLVRLTGNATSGDGTVSLTGNIKMPFSNEREINLALSGQDFRTINTRDFKLIMSPRLNFSQAVDKTTLNGKITLDEGQIRYDDLETGTRSISSDVIIDDQQPDRSMWQQADVNLQLEVKDQVHIRGYGLSANIAGTLNLDQGADTPPRAHGTLTLSNGTFERYGQTLNIDRGRLIYSGPLGNPTVDVVTSRTVRSAGNEVKVTLTLSGPANNISSRISSEPAMSDANALSWLILGRPLISASDEEGQALAGSALSFGLKKALPITQEIGSTLGLDQFDVSADTTDSASIIAGKRVNENLFIQYNYDVFSRIGGVLLNYALTPHLSVEAQSGESQSLELIYTF